MKKCPQCEQPLDRVPASRNLNSEQWDAVKAGDYYCKSCPDNGRGQTGLCYWFDSELDAAERKKIDAIMRG
jgi:hypothetical protein